MTRKENWGVMLEGQNGNFALIMEIYRLTEKLVLVEVRKKEVDAGLGPGKEIWRDTLRPQLSELIYQPEEPSTES